MQRNRMIRDKRLKAGLTVAELAAAACVGETTLKRAERGERISEETLERLERGLLQALDERVLAATDARWSVAFTK